MVLCGVLAAVAGICFLFCGKKRRETNRKMFLILFGAAVVGLLAGAMGENEGQDGVLQRKENGDGSYQETYILEAEGVLEDYDYLVEIQERRLEKEEELAYLAAAQEEIEAEFPGQNDSVNEIRGKVIIRDSYQEGRVEAEWFFDDYAVMDAEGNITAENLPEDGKTVKASVDLTCGDSFCRQEFYFLVLPKQQTEAEELLGALEEYFSAQNRTAGQEELVLPEEMQNHKLTWVKKQEHIPEKIAAVGVILMFGTALSEREKEKKRQKERMQKLKLEYPDMLSKLVLLLGAGMTIGGAWKRIAAVYEEKRKNKTIPEMPLYEEMQITCREMEGGVSEEKAYQRFGERCGEKQFRKFGNLLAQNLRKGTKGITGLLEHEVEDSFEERKNIARKYGEEAGIKLLVPMVLMLGIIVVILMVPAVLTFQL